MIAKQNSIKLIPLSTVLPHVHIYLETNDASRIHKGPRAHRRRWDWLIGRQWFKSQLWRLENRQWYGKLSSLWQLVTIVSGSEGRAAVALEVSESKPFHASFVSGCFFCFCFFLPSLCSMEVKGSEDRKQVLSFLFNVRMSMKLELPQWKGLWIYNCVLRILYGQLSCDNTCTTRILNKMCNTSVLASLSLRKCEVQQVETLAQRNNCN